MADATALSPSTPAAGQTTEAAEFNLLDQAIGATKQTEPDRAKELLRTLTEEALKGTVTYDKNLTLTINNAIRSIDETISRQLNAVVHNEKFQRLEGSWRGLHHLVQNSETGTALKIRVINITKRELYRDLSRATEFDQSQLFRKVYESEFGIAGGVPYGALIGDYEFTNHPDDVETLRLTSNVAAAAFAPFISAASPKLFGLDSYGELSSPRDLAKIFDTAEYTKWRSFRESEDARFVSLVLPRVLARLPYGRLTQTVDEFDYDEAPIDANGTARRMEHDQYCWMNAAYVLGERLTEAFAQSGWCTAIRGAENGGKVENLPFHTFKSDDGDTDSTCPTEIGITDRRDHELSNLGFLPLVHYKNHDYSVFFSGQTTQQPKKYDRPDATANAAISARLPYIMATSRISHYLKAIARDKIGSFKEAADLEQTLKQWIERYTNSNTNPSDRDKARYPLREAQIKVEEIPGKPGSYQAVAHMRPWLQLEELSTSLRMVARMPDLRK
ncbi:MAG TPA: type VI secretion system contractile sheath large subunit [Stellaceae bacterium]|jgi:type VI secretion system protein ImpC|nr:type VI secretion system contractile sheath large subunit [Stellaceae bacterium]